MILFPCRSSRMGVQATWWLKGTKKEFSVSTYITRINWTAQNIIFCVRLTLAKLFAFSWLDFPPMTAKYEKLHIRNNPIAHPRVKQPFISCPLGLLSDTLCPDLLSFPSVWKSSNRLLCKPISFDQTLLSHSVHKVWSHFDEYFILWWNCSHPGYKRCSWASSQSL